MLTRTRTARTAVLLYMLTAACAGSLPPAQVALVAADAAAESISNQYTAWFNEQWDIAEAQNAQARLDELERIDTDFLVLMAGYRASYAVAHMAARRGRPEPGELRESLRKLVAFLVFAGVPIPEEVASWQ